MKALPRAHREYIKRRHPRGGVGPRILSSGWLMLGSLLISSIGVKPPADPRFVGHCLSAIVCQNC